jgi:uncharacterized membrane protein
MKVQIKRFSLHQNAKVAAVLMAVSSLIFFIPFMLIALFAPQETEKGFGHSIMSLFFPIFYLVFGYIMMIISLAIYNFLSKYIGGIEYELDRNETQQG